MNAQLPVTADKAGEIMEAVIAKGDISALAPGDRAKLYTKVCESIGLNPLTKPFEYITLNGKLTLYARKDATDQLRKIYGVSVESMDEKREEGLAIVTVKVRDNTGRTDMAKGAVTIKNLQGDALANAIMKAETKAKRRATLSICGLGFLDETEIETIPQAKRLAKKDARDIYTRLQKEVDEITDRNDFDAWERDNKERIIVLPEDWEDTLRLRIQEHRADLARAEPVEIWDDEAIDAINATPPEWDSKWDELGPVKQAGILCADKSFWKFLAVASEANAVQVVYDRCKIKSRKELATNAEAAGLWRNLVGEYRAWQREPEVLPPSADREQASDGEGVAAPVETLDGPQTAGAADIPTAAAYTAQWKTIIDSATNAEQLRTTWNGQKELRKNINWSDEHSLGALIDRVTKAVDFLKRPA